MSSESWDGGRESVAPTYRVAHVPITLGATKSQQSAAEGVGCVAQIALSFHCGCWHQVSRGHWDRSPGPSQSIILMEQPSVICGPQLSGPSFIGRGDIVLNRGLSVL